MKMRFWQKTYIFTLVLFLICLNVGILSLTVYTYQKNVEATETAVTAEQYYVAISFERDYKDMTESNSYSSPSLAYDEIILTNANRDNVIPLFTIPKDNLTRFPDMNLKMNWNLS